MSTTSRSLTGVRVVVFASPANAGHVAWALTSRGAVVHRAATGAAAITALLEAQDRVLVTDRLVPGVVLVLQPRHLLPRSSEPASFGDEFLEYLNAPADPMLLAAAVARAARRLVMIPPVSSNGSEAA